jgi:hypothetical protein
MSVYARFPCVQAATNRFERPASLIVHSMIERFV